ncbi:MAG: hypothetical protein ACD_82C00098G0002 [uncultured bacterium]|nr:MAG: hypothetical protein ACD_82C00098G0002 [uncultured bacterium]
MASAILELVIVPGVISASTMREFVKFPSVSLCTTPPVVPNCFIDIFPV